MARRIPDSLARRLRRAAVIHDDPRAAARAAGLTYVTGSEPGLSRIRRGRGFAYLDAHGHVVSPTRRQWIAGLAIPPAWTDVWICTRPDGHVLATGFDDRGRKQYLYHERWRELRDRATFDRLALVGAAVPDIRAAVDAQLRRRTVDEPRVLAGMVRMLDRTGIRVGNEAYERLNRTVGLTTLRWQHVSLSARRVDMRFVAKSGIRAELQIDDRPLARLLAELESAPRRRVFTVDGRPLGADDLNRYLGGIAANRITAKDFRTWRGTVSALAYLTALPPDTPPSRHHAVAAVDAAASALRNTRAVARAHYVHPGLIERYLAGALPDVRPVAADGLDEAERALVALLTEIAGTPMT